MGKQPVGIRSHEEQGHTGCHKLGLEVAVSDFINLKVEKRG